MTIYADGVVTAPFANGVFAEAVYAGDEKVWPVGIDTHVYTPRSGIGNGGESANGQTWSAFIAGQGRILFSRNVGGGGATNELNVNTMWLEQMSGTATGVPTSQMLAATPDGSKVFFTQNNPGGVFVLDTATNKAVATLDANVPAFGVVVAAGKVYVSHRNAKVVTVYDANTHAKITTIPVTNGTEQLAANPQESGVFAASPAGKCVYAIATTSNTITKTITDPAGVGKGIAANQQGIYSCAGNQVTQLNAATGTVITRYTAPDATHVFNSLTAFSANGEHRLYACSPVADAVYAFGFDSGGVGFLRKIIQLPDLTGPVHLSVYRDGAWGVTANGDTNNAAKNNHCVLYLGQPGAVALSAFKIAPEDRWVVDPEHDAYPELPPQEMPDPEPPEEPMG